MKTKIILSFAVLFFTALLFISQRAAAQVYHPPDRCLCTPTNYPKAHGINAGADTIYYYNQDSLCKLDTCNWLSDNNYNGDCNTIFYTYFNQHVNDLSLKRVWGRGGWEITFFYKAINVPTIIIDTILIKTWQDIDSTIYPEIRKQFQNIDTIFSTYKLIKEFPFKGSENNYSNWIDQKYLIFFDNNKLINFMQFGNYLSAIRFSMTDTVMIDYKPPIEGFLLGIQDYNADNKNINYHINQEATEIKITIQNNTNLDNKINIYNLSGDIIYSNNIYNSHNIIIDISNYTKGIYFLQINNKIYKFFK